MKTFIVCMVNFHGVSLGETLQPKKIEWFCCILLHKVQLWLLQSSVLFAYITFVEIPIQLMSCVCVCECVFTWNLFRAPNKRPWHMSLFIGVTSHFCTFHSSKHVESHRCCCLNFKQKDRCHNTIGPRTISSWNACAFEVSYNSLQFGPINSLSQKKNIHLFPIHVSTNI